MIEGIEYRRHVVRFQVKRVTGEWLRRRWVRWSPGFPWVREEVARELESKFTRGDIKPRSVTIREEP